MTSAQARCVPSRAARIAFAPVGALQFLTRLPVPRVAYHDRSLADALAWFPWVGALVALLAGEIDRILLVHLGGFAAALAAVAATVLLTGGLHEDGLADCADAFGMRHDRLRTLAILRDSRIGTYGALAVAFSVLGRVGLIAQLPPGGIVPGLVAAHTLSRWTSLPLSLLPAARAEEGQGARVAGRVEWPVLLFGTLSAAGLSAWALGRTAFPAMLVVVGTAAASGWFYRRRIGGVSGDCFGATQQLSEVAVLLTILWR